MRHLSSLLIPLPLSVANSSSLTQSPFVGSKLPIQIFHSSSLMVHTFNLGNEKPMTVTALLNLKIESITMVDSGTSTSFIDAAFVNNNNLTPHVTE